MREAHHVAMVLSENFGDRLHALSKIMHVWIVNTPTNRQAAEKIWTENSVHSLEQGITTMDASGYNSPEELFARMLDAVDEHHGEWSHDPVWTSVHVYGIKLCNAIHKALGAYGATDIQQQTDHFIATRSK